ncbi:hypothetical protein [Flavobacterium sp.]|uniref:hypothetical protein n=1 Tax=Flavobacterium sp. TaxID=239 RepID=UPI00375165F6
MIVTIKEEIFNNPKNNSDLNDLMHFFRKGKHRMHLKKVGDFIAFENSEWKKTLLRSDIDFLKESIGKLDKKEVVISQTGNEDEFNPKEAFSYLEQNLRIILEQEEYEKPFILKIIKEFDSSNELINALQNNWLEFYNGAGSNSESILRTRITRDISTNQHFKEPLNKYLRFYEIKDSDREYCTFNNGEVIPQELPEKKTKFLKKENIPYHILYKREKENYMPDSVFNGFLQTAKKNDDRKEFSKLYLNFTPQQKDFFDLEKGFQKKEKTTLKIEIQNLYNNFKDGKNISNKEHKVLAIGLPFSNFKSTFSNHFNHVSREDLEKRILYQPKLKSEVNLKDKTERIEFEHIIHEIKYLL